MKHYISVGITGGIGSGKSYICQVLETMGYPVFYSDQEARDIIENDPRAIAFVTSNFGDEAYKKGKLVRGYIAKKVFEDDSLREKLNQFIHPLVREHFSNWANDQDAKIVFSEAAIFFETGAYKNYDQMILVTAPHKLKIERVKKRSGLTEEQIMSRMNAQWPDEKKIPLADFVINNDQKEPLLPQIVQMLEAIK